MNPILTLTRNNLSLTKRLLDSICAQEVPCSTLFVDNGSTDGSAEFLQRTGNVQAHTMFIGFDWNRGVSAGWNTGLKHFFEVCGVEHVLVVGNDTVLPPWFYSKILQYDYPVVTGVSVNLPNQIGDCPPTLPINPHPDFSAFLIRRYAWEKIGPFDERMKHYASDCDYHIRGHRLGVEMVKACVPFFHEGSATIANAPEKEKLELYEQANADRAVFHRTYGCYPGEEAYYDLFRQAHLKG